jgi:hypothetical protein
MNFTNKRFAEVFASLLPTGATSKTAQDERRRAPRIDLEFKIHLLLVGTKPEKSVEVEMRDLSVRGMKFTAPAALAGGQQFILAVPQLSGEPQLLLCTVVHSRKADNGRFAVGAEFTMPLRRRDRAA